MRLSLLTGFWSSTKLLPEQQALVRDALNLTHSLKDLHPFLQNLLNKGTIRANSAIKVKALCKFIPLRPRVLEINFDMLIPPGFDPHKMRHQIEQLEPPLKDSKLAWLEKTLDRTHLELATLLVHEGTHLKEGYTLSRHADEVKAYQAEWRFLAHFLQNERYATFAESLVEDLKVAAKEEGLDPNLWLLET